MSEVFGITINEVDTAPSSVVSIPSAVIALIGTAPIGPQNEVTLVQNTTDAAAFGPEVPGFSIPQALSAIFKQGPAQVLVVNVATQDHASQAPFESVLQESFVLTTTYQLAVAPATAIVLKDSTATTTYTLTTDYTVSPQGVVTLVGSGAITPGDTVLASYDHLETQTVTNMAAVTTAPPFGSTVVNVRNFDYATTYVEGTDYTIDEYGRISVIYGGGITEGQVITIQYDLFDGIAAADIVGTAAPRTGMYQYELAYTTWGYNPTIFIAPDYSTVSGVYELLRTTANAYNGICILDATAGLTRAQVVTARGVAAAGNLNVADERVALCYPKVGVYDAFSDSVELRNSSPFWAGLIAKIDRQEGFHASPSNHSFLGISSLETVLTWTPGGLTTDVNILKNYGVLTIRSASISAGNRSSAYPASTNIKTFIQTRRTADVINASIQQNFVQFMDKPISPELRDTMLQVGNAYLGRLRGEGKILKGLMSYDPAKNSDADLALGKLTFDMEITPTTPAEQIIINSSIDLTGFASTLS